MTRRQLALNVGCVAFAVASLISAGLRPYRVESVPVLISGDIQGYLAPCGCTSPMTGGIRRLATAVAQNRGQNGLFLVNGGLIDAQPPFGQVGITQNNLKAQTLAEAFDAMNADAVNLGSEEASGGRGLLMELTLLAQNRVISTSLAESPTNKIARWIDRGPLLIGGVTVASEVLAQVSEEAPVSTTNATKDLVAEAARLGKTPVLLLRGDLENAKASAAAFPSLALVVYQTAGTAPAAPLKVGNTLLVTPGDHTKNLIRLDFSEGQFSAYRVFTLTPDYADDAKVSKLYRDYLRRVDKAHLIEQLVRVKGPAFAGTAACLKCHQKALVDWQHSAHSHALKDLEMQGHARDPDCLSCHVTGLESKAGFTNRLLTPKLANVTCESCHGPAAAHVKAPKLVRLPKLGPTSCLKCHGTENSPNFNFQTYWAKISHR